MSELDAIRRLIYLLASGTRASCQKTKEKDMPRMKVSSKSVSGIIGRGFRAASFSWYAVISFRIAGPVLKNLDSQGARESIIIDLECKIAIPLQ